MSNAINDNALESLKRRAADGPVTMLNLLKFKPGGGWAQYARYAAATAPLLEKAGGKVAHLGKAAEEVIGTDNDWDLVLLVTYPTRGAFLSMVGSEAYQAIAHLRAEALTRSALVALDPFQFDGEQ